MSWTSLNRACVGATGAMTTSQEEAALSSWGWEWPAVTHLLAWQLQVKTGVPHSQSFWISSFVTGTRWPCSCYWHLGHSCVSTLGQGAGKPQTSKHSILALEAHTTRVLTEPGCTPWLDKKSYPPLLFPVSGAVLVLHKPNVKRAQWGWHPALLDPSLTLLSDKQASTGCAGYQWFSCSLVLWLSPVGSCADVCPKGSICSMPSLSLQPLRRSTGSRETPGEFPVPTRTKPAAPREGKLMQDLPGEDSAFSLGPLSLCHKFFHWMKPREEGNLSLIFFL